MTNTGGQRTDVLRWNGPAYRSRPNLVVPAQTPAGERRVIKVCAIDHREPGEYAGERDALRHYATLHYAAAPGPDAGLHRQADGTATRERPDAVVRAVRLLGYDDQLRMLELELLSGRRLDAGWPSAAPDAELTAQLAKAMRSLWAEPRLPGAWRPLHRWMRALDTAVRGVPDTLRETARDLGRELRAQATTEVLLHGDLHHENVVAQDDGTLVVIDPKGILGAPGFDVGALLWNPIDRVLVHPQVMPARLDVLAAELPLTREEIRSWGWVCCVLSAVWDAGGGGDPAYPLAVADLVSRS